MTIYAALEKVLASRAGAYRVGVPFQSAPVDLKTGYISFFEISRRNIVGRSETLSGEGTLETSVTEEVTVQIDVVRLIDHRDPENGARETAVRLKDYLSTREAMEAFYALGWELAPVWEEIRTDGWFGELKRWEERSFFRLKFYRETSYAAPDAPLKNFKIDVKPV